MYDDKTWARFQAKVVYVPAPEWLEFGFGPCEYWDGAQRGGRVENRYGSFSYRGKTVYAHRFSYEHHYGMVPDRYEVDHICKNRLCTNPLHLRAIKVRDNRRRTSAKKTVKWDG